MTDKKNIFEKDFEDSFEKSLKSIGYLFPSTEKEVILFEKTNELEKIPDHYCNPIELLAKPNPNILNSKNVIFFNNTIDNLASAARNGEKIPDTILKKMKSDRSKSENNEE